VWEVLNQIIFVAELLLIFVGLPLVFRKRNTVKTVIFMGCVVALNFVIYLLPAFFEKLVLGEERSFFLYLLDGIPAAAKSLVGDTETGIVEVYASHFPEYGLIFGLGIAIAVVSTSFAAISTFGRRISNAFKLVLRFSGNTCDLIAGNSEEAIQYAKTQKNAVLVLPENTEKSAMTEYIENGCTVIRRKLSKAFFAGKWFHTKTRYNVILLQDEALDEILAYLGDERKTKDIRFYLETESGVLETLKRRIDAMGSLYRTRITLFSRNELLARVFVDKNPYTKHMPREFFGDDTSLKDGVKLNLFLLGYGALSGEICRQFVINNQFAVQKDGEYHASPIRLSVYDKTADKNAWSLCGLPNALRILEENQTEYFPMPEYPYEVDCVKDGGYEFDTIREIANKALDEDSFSYIIVDTGNVYRNIEIAEKFSLLLDKCNCYHIFVRNRSIALTHDRITCYGDTGSVFTHDVIVGDALVGLARDVNRFYSGKDTWNDLSYFGMASNIALAQNLRLKLNLLGVDYQNDGRGEGLDLASELPAKLGDATDYESCFGVSVRNALLAQEHFRWNAFHLLAGYLPMKRCRVKVWEENGKIKKTIKDDTLKKHACITTFAGLHALSNELSARANEIAGGKTYTAKDFDYYRYDDLLLRAIPGFLEENRCSVAEK